MQFDTLQANEESRAGLIILCRAYRSACKPGGCMKHRPKRSMRCRVGSSFFSRMKAFLLESESGPCIVVCTKQIQFWAPAAVTFGILYILSTLNGVLRLILGDRFILMCRS